MGADLYITNKDNDALQEKLSAEFNKLVEKRDKLALKLKAQSKFNTDVWSVEWTEPAVQKIQDDINVVMKKMNWDNEYYYRDSYNDSSVLWQMGLSWWSDVIPLCTKTRKEGRPNLPPARCKKLKELLLSAEPVFRKNMEELENSKDREYYEEKYEKLLRFVDLGIANGGIDASL